MSGRWHRSHCMSNHLAWNGNGNYIFVVLSQKRKDSPSKKWILYSVSLVQTTALQILRGMNMARIFLPYFSLYLALLIETDRDGARSTRRFRACGLN